MFECSLCSEINHEEENNMLYNIIAPVTGIKDRILFQTANWVVMPTLGCFVNGYLLIVSKEHIPSISFCSDIMLDELEFLIQDIRKINCKLYHSDSVLFEHGMVSVEERGGCCVDHAHVHILPFNEEIDAEICKNAAEKVEIEMLTNVKQLVEKACRSYLLYENKAGKRVIIFSDYIPSQYMRQIISKKIGKEKEWDWREHFFLVNILQTIKELKPSFDQLPRK